MDSPHEEGKTNTSKAGKIAGIGILVFGAALYFGAVSKRDANATDALNYCERKMGGQNEFCTCTANQYSKANPMAWFPVIGGTFFSGEIDRVDREVTNLCRQ